MLFDNLFNIVSSYIVSEGYCESITRYSTSLNGYEIEKYLIERAEKYRIGFRGATKLSSLATYTIFNGIAFAIYNQWSASSIREKNFYFFCKRYQEILQIKYLLALNPEDFMSTKADYFLSRLFSQCETIIKYEFHRLNYDDIEIVSNPRESGDYNYYNPMEVRPILEFFHNIGQAIFYNWKEGTSARLAYVKELISGTGGFNPFGL